MKSKSAFVRTMTAIVFLVGIAFCLFVSWKLGNEAGISLRRISVGEWVWLAIWMLLQLLLAAAAWRRYLQSFSEYRLPWLVAFQEMGLLLIGKYVPGGVFGFLARMYSDASGSRSKNFMAGLAEQSIGVGTTIGLGLLSYLSARTGNCVWLILVPLLPLLALFAVDLLFRMGNGLSERMRSSGFGRRAMLEGAIYCLIQQILWACMSGWVAWWLFAIPFDAMLGVAGSFGIAVGAGILILFSPGGIGVREGAMIALTGPWLGPENALLLAALLRLLSVGLDLLAGAIALIAKLWMQTKRIGAP